MRVKSLTVLIIAILLTACLSFIAVNGLDIGQVRIKPVSETLSLGLDLRGGIYTVFTAEQGDCSDEEFESLLAATGEVLRSRLTSQGYTEANVSVQGASSIRVEIPDISDPSKVVELLGTPAKLEFLDPSGNVVIEGKDIVKVAPAMSEGTYVVAFELSDEGAKAFASATARLIGRKIYIVLDGNVISDPGVQQKISGGRGQISFGAGLTVSESYAEAEKLTTLIMSGALPLDIRESETRAISAVLGENAIDRALTAGIIGVLLVFAFMLIVYRLPGFAADVALIWYILIVFFAMGLLKIQLTLPGIAGILLGIGMAVDANVVIFERFREELDRGGSLETAVKAGFKNALSAIVDSNITTLIASFVLMYFGTGSVKGFSYTLCISVVASMFTAVFLSRFLLRHAVRLGFTSRGVYSRKGRFNPATRVMRHKKALMLVPAILILAALVFNLCGAGITPGIDFTGGSIIEYAVNGEFATSDIESILSQNGYSDSQVSKVADAQGGMTGLQIRIKLTGDENEALSVRETLDAALSAAYPDIEYVSMEHAGAVSSAELIKNALKSMGAALALMLVYIAIRFDFCSGAAALIALVHDMLIMLAFMSFFGAFYQINSPFIAALLTILGYSINDTIVVFDRIRENKKLLKDADNGDIVDRSVSDSLARTVNTSVTTLFTLVALYVLGVASIKEFTFPLIAGMVAGSYSSNLLAGPVWARLLTAAEKRRAARKPYVDEDEEAIERALKAGTAYDPAKPGPKSDDGSGADA